MPKRADIHSKAYWAGKPKRVVYYRNAVSVMDLEGK